MIHSPPRRLGATRRRGGLWIMVAARRIAGQVMPPEYARGGRCGEPTSYPKGDYDLDGDVDWSDTTALSNFISGGGGWNLDFNRDGNADSDDTTDHTAYASGYAGGTGGPNVQSRSAILNRLGYAGCQWDPLAYVNHVRYRVYRPDIGGWTRRDPSSIVPGMHQEAYVYVGSRPQAMGISEQWRNRRV
jgi:RHS repeat-associated protein